MESPLHLQIPSQVVEIAGERFTLREMSAARSIAYMKVFEEIGAEEDSDPMPSGLASDDPQMKAWLARYLVRWNAPVRFLLGKDDEWIEGNMVRSTKAALLAIQRELNAKEPSGGNVPTPGDASA